MLKFVSVTLTVTVLIGALTENPKVTLAETCASKCGPHPIQFTPGQPILIKVVNSTSSLIKLEKLRSTSPIPLQPGQEFQSEYLNDTEPNISLVFWNERGQPLRAIVSKPNFGTLRVELRPNWQTLGDRSIYLREDGRVNVF